MTRALLACLSLLVVPWSVQSYVGGAVAFVFAWGLAALDPLSVTLLPAFLGHTAGLPGYIEAWPLSVALWLAATGSAALGLLGREDHRVTAGLLALAGGAALSVSTGFAVQPGRTAYPTGTLALWAVAAWRLRAGSGPYARLR